MIYVNNAELEKIFGSSSNITFSTVQVEFFQPLKNNGYRNKPSHIVQSIENILLVIDHVGGIMMIELRGQYNMLT